MPTYRVKVEAEVENVTLEGIVQLYAESKDDAERKAKDLVLEGKLVTKYRIIKYHNEGMLKSLDVKSVEEMCDPDKKFER